MPIESQQPAAKVPLHFSSRYVSNMYFIGLSPSADGPEAALVVVDTIAATGELEEYHQMPVG